MSYSVAPVNAAVYNEGKAAFRQPTVREEHKEEKSGCCKQSKRGLHEKITDKNP